MAVVSLHSSFNQILVENWTWCQRGVALGRQKRPVAWLSGLLCTKGHLISVDPRACRILIRKDKRTRVRIHSSWPFDAQTKMTTFYCAVRSDRWKMWSGGSVCAEVIKGSRSWDIKKKKQHCVGCAANGASEMKHLKNIYNINIGRVWLLWPFYLF